MKSLIVFHYWVQIFQYNFFQGPMHGGQRKRKRTLSIINIVQNKKVHDFVKKSIFLVVIMLWKRTKHILLHFLFGVSFPFINQLPSTLVVVFSCVIHQIPIFQYGSINFCNQCIFLYKFFWLNMPNDFFAPHCIDSNHKPIGRFTNGKIWFLGLPCTW